MAQLIFVGKNISEFEIVKDVFNPTNTGGKVCAVFENPEFTDGANQLKASAYTVFCDANGKILQQIGEPVTWLTTGASYQVFIETMLNALLPNNTTIKQSIESGITNRITDFESIAINAGYSKE